MSDKPRSPESKDETAPLEYEGELFSPTFEFTWIETGNEIPAAYHIVPISLIESPNTIEHAALHLAADDLRLAQDSFAEAAKLGLPSDANNLSRALIHAGVMSYARPFATGARGFRLSEKFFEDIWTNTDADLHGYLYALRDKHVAHSVNGFESASTVGVVVTDPNFHLTGTNPSGVGVTRSSMVGLPLYKLKACPDHIVRMIARIDRRIEELRQQIHAEMRATLKVGEPLAVAPLLTVPDRSKVLKRRR